MGSGASKNKANTPDKQGVENSAVKLGLRWLKARRSRMLHNATKKKIARQLSCVPQNRATAQRTRAAERLASKNAASATVKGMEEEGEEDKEKLMPLGSSGNVERGNLWSGVQRAGYYHQNAGVIKVAKAMPGEFGNQTAEWEQFILEKMFRADPDASIVRILDKGMLVDQNNVGMEFMVLEKVELDVRTYIYEETSAPKRRVRVCNVALQFLKGICDLHMQGILHRDLKPDNMGICSREQPIVLIFDLGMARMYTDGSGSIRPPRTVVNFRGTPEWASGNASKNRDQSRFDDLVAWLYIMAELFDPDADSKQPLPWSFCRNNGAIRYLKSAHCPARLLLRNCPSQFYAINTYLQSANRYKPPNYGFIADRVLEAIEECKKEKSLTAVGPVQLKL
uniref:Protein kinase domain-containing protein n=1 Tax=Ditylenchus dipsaci TaxID=166011 RepID=A0A915EB10_9BILA